ncbi:GntR family transcriptional regulator [Fictibacillus norfolkensis]|jgi:GntR family transcriptional regulator|uniref:GntR family transcriptional regulator n=1 Tax=Fictibacillus norfolkensis TaxID=2762233 RepID=A0ABR8SL50_9BACL|nr:GntR family transcriptional regulator [Fictibacillus norfolkensis]MBD7963854.1 GntR family transcriptional regulator [Fictibacillus norfolkensis]
MILNLDPRSNTPIWEQVVHQIKELILREILLPEEKLPSVRELSGTLLINPNTVSKAYQELERQGIIETLRGKGTFVSASIIPKADDQKIMELKQQLKQLFIEASYLGIDHQTLSKWLKNYSEELGGKDNHAESE